MKNLNSISAGNIVQTPEETNSMNMYSSTNKPHLEDTDKFCTQSYVNLPHLTEYQIKELASMQKEFLKGLQRVLKN